MSLGLRVPCAFQGGKQRVASQLVDVLLDAAGPSTRFYDLCCGSGAVSIELVNRGVDPSQLVLLDKSSWGAFWLAIGTGSFDMGVFGHLVENIPTDQRDVKAHMTQLASMPVGANEAEIYPLMQSCAFGGKQIWYDTDHWENAFFRDYWEPTETSVRRSPANPMQPSPKELLRRVVGLVTHMRGLTCIRDDISAVFDETLPTDSLVYVDPPYRGTTGYAFGFDVESFIANFRGRSSAPLFVSEAVPLAKNAIQLTWGGAKGGITGMRNGRHQEWLTRC